MSIKDILNVVDVSSPRPSSKVAIDLAKQTQANLKGLAVAVEPMVPGFVASPMPSEYLVDVQKKSVESMKSAIEDFTKQAKDSGVNVESHTVEVVSGGTLGPFILQCRTTDLIVIGQDKPAKPEPMRDLLIEAALFDTGIPILIVPHNYDGEFKPNHAVIAWDGTKHSARAVHASLPFLELASKTTTVSVNHGRKQADKLSEEIVTYLQRHISNVTSKIFNEKSDSPADTIADFAKQESADVIIMGGYGHSRMREVIMGGATRTMLNSMSIPVIMAH